MKTVAVLGGGTSSERTISLETAAAVVEHLPRTEFRPLPVEILQDGRWSVDLGDPVPAEAALSLLLESQVDVVFPGLHGRFGEDGTIQGFLEVAGLPYVGSGVAASALAMDKCRAREVLAAQGITVPDALELFGIGAVEAGRIVRDRFGLPVVVKDPTGGSSLDMAIAADEKTLLAILDRLLSRPGGRVLAEEYVPGPEVTCAVLGNASVGDALESLPLVLIRPLNSDWFDYETKYDPAAVEKLCPAPLPPETSTLVTRQALLAHRTLGCDGLTRTDFLIPDDGVPRFLELNTLPGLTAASLCPKAAASVGMPFGELLRRLVTMALDRHGCGKERP